MKRGEGEKEEKQHQQLYVCVQERSEPTRGKRNNLIDIYDGPCLIDLASSCLPV